MSLSSQPQAKGNGNGNGNNNGNGNGNAPAKDEDKGNGNGNNNEKENGKDNENGNSNKNKSPIACGPDGTIELDENLERVDDLPDYLIDPQSKVQYTYDKAGNRLTMTNDDRTQNYTYNSLNQLISDGDNTYEYDKNGNIQTTSSQDGKTTYTHNNANQMTMVEFEDESYVSYSYDGLGRRVYRVEMSWKEYDGIEKGKDKNKGNNGKGDEKKNENANNNNGKGKGKANCNDSAGNPGKGNGPLNNPGKGKKIGLYKQFGENGEDHVYHKETTYLYEGMSNTLHKEYSETGSPYAEYYNGPNGQLTSRKMFGLHGLSNPSHDPNLKTTGGLLYYQYDGQRNVSEVTDRHGDLIERYRYDAFGGIFTGTTSPYNHHGYTGMRYDGKTGLVDLNARWYNPTAGKFMNEDTYPGILSQPQTQNRYSYALNNPVNMWDPSGHVAVPVDGGAIPSWVRSQESPTIIEPNGIFTNYHYWTFKDYFQTDVKSELLNTVMEEKYVRLNFLTTGINNWTYDYKKIKTINDGGLERRVETDESTKTFRDPFKDPWHTDITAEQIAGENAKEITKYGEPAIARMLNKLINSPAEFDNFVERERQKHLRQIQPVVPNQWIFERLDNYLQFSESEFEISLNSVELISSNGDYAHTYAGYSRVLGNPTNELAGNPFAFGYITVGTANFMTEDIGTMLSPDATLDERAMAALFTFYKPAKAADLVGDIAKGTGQAGKITTPAALVKEGQSPVIGKMSDLNKSGAINSNEFKVADHLPDMGNPKANWAQNDGVLRSVMNEGKPIRDASPFPMENAGFLGAERNLLQSRGWTYSNGYWNPQK